jgi:hypothetical protein
VIGYTVGETGVGALARPSSFIPYDLAFGTYQPNVTYRDLTPEPPSLRRVIYLIYTPSGFIRVTSSA